MIKDDIAHRIKQSRKELGITIKELAARTKEFSPARIGNWEQGTRSPGPGEAKLLAETLEVSPAYLLCLSDSPKGDLHLQNEFLPRYVPLIPLEQANLGKKELDQLIQQLSPYANDENKISLDKQLQDNAGTYTFATKIADNSMKPEFNIGDIIIADPDRIPKPGDYVIAFSQPLKHPVVRKYRELNDDSNKHGAYELIPLNSDWATTKIHNPKAGKILSVVIGQIKKF